MEINLNVNVQLNASQELLGAIQSFVQSIPGKAAELKPVAAKVPARSKPVAKPEDSTPVLKNQAGEVIEGNAEVPVPSAETPTSDDAPERPERNVTVEQLREAVRVKAQAGFREELKKILNSFDAPNVTSLKEDQYSAFLEKVEEL